MKVFLSGEGPDDLGESEGHGDAKSVLQVRHAIDVLTAKVAAIEEADLDRVPEDAASLRLWLDRATVVFVTTR